MHVVSLVVVFTQQGLRQLGLGVPHALGVFVIFRCMSDAVLRSMPFLLNALPEMRGWAAKLEAARLAGTYLLVRVSDNL